MRQVLDAAAAEWIEPGVEANSDSDSDVGTRSRSLSSEDRSSVSFFYKKLENYLWYFIDFFKR